MEDRGAESLKLESLLDISNQIALAQQAVSGHPFAAKVLVSFGVDSLFDAKFVGNMLAKLVGGEAEKHGTAGEYWPLFRRWQMMQECVKPLSELTVPVEVGQEKDFDDVLTIEILRGEDTTPTLETLCSVLEDIDDLYQAFLTLQKNVSAEPLRIIYVASGSSMRVDLKGLGEPIKHIKNLLVEGWSLWRHRKSTELAHNSRSLLSSLKTFSEIDKHVKTGAMGKADGEALKGRMQKAMLGLFGEGALPREIPTVENVSNYTLIEFGSPKLLEKPSSVGSDTLAKLERPVAPIDVEVLQPQGGGKTKHRAKKTAKSRRRQ